MMTKVLLKAGVILSAAAISGAFYTEFDSTSKYSQANVDDKYIGGGCNSHEATCNYDCFHKLIDDYWFSSCTYESCLGDPVCNDVFCIEITIDNNAGVDDHKTHLNEVYDLAKPAFSHSFVETTYRASLPHCLPGPPDYIELPRWQYPSTWSATRFNDDGSKDVSIGFHITDNNEDSSCDLMKSMIQAGLGEVPGGSALGSLFNAIKC